MRGARKKSKGNNGLRSAFLFAFLVVSIIIFSFSLKIYSTLKKSVYDGNHRFTLSVLREENPQVLSFYPSNKEIFIYSYSGGLEEFKALEIPSDALLSSNIVFEKNDFSSKVSHLLFRTKNNMIFWDKFRLFYFVKTISQERIIQSSLGTDTSSLFLETEIKDEAQSIQIVNATGESGFANRLSKLISNMGGNIVLLTTSQSTEKVSSIEYSKDSYTINRLRAYLGFSMAKTDKRGIADVIITIGKDSLNTQKF